MIPEPHTTTLGPGDRLGRYEILHALGVGGMAEIYLARITGIESFERRVALKRMKPSLARNRSYQMMFLDEARLQALLHHGNIAQAHELCFDGESYFYAMEYVRGLDLRRLMRRCWANGIPFPADHAARVAIETAAGLHAAHEAIDHDGTPANIIHRDVSPANILLSMDGCVKLIDFGVAKAARRQTETDAGQAKGKVSYMSPEQCRGIEVDRRADVFALGIVLWELTVGRRLFTGKTDYEILDNIAFVRVPAPSAVVAGYPLELEAIVMRCLALDPARRYPTAEALQLDLESYALRTRLCPSSASLGGFVRAMAMRPAVRLELEIVGTPSEQTPVFDATAFDDRERVARPIRAPTLRGW